MRDSWLDRPCLHEDAIAVPPSRTAALGFVWAAGRGSPSVPKLSRWLNRLAVPSVRAGRARPAFCSPWASSGSRILSMWVPKLKAGGGLPRADFVRTVMERSISSSSARLKIDRTPVSSSATAAHGRVHGIGTGGRILGLGAALQAKLRSPFPISIRQR